MTSTMQSAKNTAVVRQVELKAREGRDSQYYMNKMSDLQQLRHMAGPYSINGLLSSADTSAMVNHSGKSFIPSSSCN